MTLRQLSHMINQIVSLHCSKITKWAVNKKYPTLYFALIDYEGLIVTGTDSI